MRSAARTMFAGLWVVLTVTAVEAKERVYYYHNDHLGTPQAMSDASGRIVWEAEYEPFGKATVNGDPDGDGKLVINNLRFPGQYYDAETGLHYNFHRDYDPETGRYLQPDPIGLFGGLNPYRYALDNPINSVDPRGLYPREVHYAMTYKLARDVGLDDKTARLIAEANQGLDEGFFDDPANPLNWLFGNSRLHFLEKNAAEALLGKCEKNGFQDILEFGRMLHAMQDSYSHQGYGFPFGHILDEPWDKTDGYDPYVNIRDWTMRENTRNWLQQFKNAGILYYRAN